MEHVKKPMSYGDIVNAHRDLFSTLCWIAGAGLYCFAMAVMALGVEYVTESMSIDVTYNLYGWTGALALVSFVAGSIMVFTDTLDLPNVPEWSPVHYVALFPWVALTFASIIGGSILYWGTALTTPSDHWRVYETGKILHGGHLPVDYHPLVADSLVFDPNQTIKATSTVSVQVENSVVTGVLTYELQLRDSISLHTFISDNALHIGVGDTIDVQKQKSFDLISERQPDFSKDIQVLVAETLAGKPADENSLLVRFAELRLGDFAYEYGSLGIEVKFTSLDISSVGTH